MIRRSTPASAAAATAAATVATLNAILPILAIRPDPTPVRAPPDAPIRAFDLAPAASSGLLGWRLCRAGAGRGAAFLANPGIFAVADRDWPNLYPLVVAGKWPGPGPVAPRRRWGTLATPRGQSDVRDRRLHRGPGRAPDPPGGAPAPRIPRL